MVGSIQRMFLQPGRELLAGALGENPGAVGIQMPVVLPEMGVWQRMDLRLQRVKIGMTIAICCTNCS